jgi:haloalkane dehalogenase
VHERPTWFGGELFSVKSRWLDLDGHVVHYVDEGSGPTLLMLHGNPTWSFLYRRLIAALRGGFRCVALDYPGFGLSTAAPGFGFTAAEQSGVVRRFVETLDLGGVVPVMQDWGGPIGVGAMLDDPQRYQGMVVGNTYAWPSSLYMRAFGQVMGGRLTGSLLSQRLNLFVDVMTPVMFRRRTLTPAEKAMYAGPFPTAQSREPVRVMPREISTAHPFLESLEQRLPAITSLPALLVWADRDVAFREPERRRWQALLTDRTDHILRGAGHFWQDDAGEEAAAVIADWWRTRSE